MANVGEAQIGTAAETLARLRDSAAEGLCVQTAFPNIGMEMYIAYFPGCGHYLVRVTNIGTDPSDPDNILINEVELSEEDVIMRMCALMENDIARDPMGAEARIALEMSMVDVEGED